MSWQDKALAAFWADAFANEPLDSHRRIEAAITAAAASLLPSTDAPMADHPITPPPELVAQWLGTYFGTTVTGEVSEVELALATQAARWGADTELEACCEWLPEQTPWDADKLRAARRPKPPSLKEQALHALLHIDQGQHNERCHIIRRALELLDD